MRVVALVLAVNELEIATMRKHFIRRTGRGGCISDPGRFGVATCTACGRTSRSTVFDVFQTLESSALSVPPATRLLPHRLPRSRDALQWWHVRHAPDANIAQLRRRRRETQHQCRQDCRGLTCAPTLSFRVEGAEQASSSCRR